MRIVVLATLCLALAGCGELTSLGSGGDGCDSASASDVTLGIVRDQVIKLAGEAGDDEPALSKAKIRATVRDLKLSLEDIRTSKDDPNSSKTFCTATIKLVAPAQMVIDADAARQAVGYNSIEELADNVNVTKEANAFTAEINFNVQPTDDGEKIFSEIEDGGQTFRFFAELVQAALLRSSIMDAQAENDRIASEQQAELDAANREVELATLEEAKVNNAAAVASINAIWKAIPSGPREQMLPAQRIWLRKTTATCKLEAAAEEDDQEVARLNCETREQQSRASYLRSFATEAINQEYSDQ